MHGCEGRCGRYARIAMPMKYTQIEGGRVSNMSLGTVQLGLNYGIANAAGKPSMQLSG